MAVGRVFAEQSFIPAFSGEKRRLEVHFRKSMPEWIATPLRAYLLSIEYSFANGCYVKPCSSSEEAATQAGMIAEFISRITPPPAPWGERH